MRFSRRVEADFQKVAKKNFDFLLEKFHQKIAIFWRALPLKISFYWHKRPKFLSPNIDISKQYKKGTLWVDKGSNP